MSKTYNNIPLDSEAKPSVFPIQDVWFIETTKEGDIKLVTRENEDIHLFRSSCCILFQTKTITIR